MPEALMHSSVQWHLGLEKLDRLMTMLDVLYKHQDANSSEIMKINFMEFSPFYS